MTLLSTTACTALAVLLSPATVFARPEVSVDTSYVMPRGDAKDTPEASPGIGVGAGYRFELGEIFWVAPRLDMSWTRATSGEGIREAQTDTTLLLAAVRAGVDPTNAPFDLFVEAGFGHAHHTMDTMIGDFRSDELGAFSIGGGIESPHLRTSWADFGAALAVTYDSFTVSIEEIGGKERPNDQLRVRLEMFASF